MGRCTPVRPAPLCKSDHCQLTRTVPPIAITPPILTHFSLPRWRGRWPQAGGVMGGISSISPRSVGANGVRPAHEAGGAWDRTPSGHTPPCPTPGIQLSATCWQARVGMLEDRSPPLPINLPVSPVRVLAGVLNVNVTVGILRYVVVADFQVQVDTRCVAAHAHLGDQLPL